MGWSWGVCRKIRVLFCSYFCGTCLKKDFRFGMYFILFYLFIFLEGWLKANAIGISLGESCSISITKHSIQCRGLAQKIFLSPLLSLPILTVISLALFFFFVFIKIEMRCQFIAIRLFDVQYWFRLCENFGCALDSFWVSRFIFLFTVWFTFLFLKKKKLVKFQLFLLPC